jgi:hypothetical protein
MELSNITALKQGSYFYLMTYWVLRGNPAETVGY